MKPHIRGRQRLRPFALLLLSSLGLAPVPALADESRLPALDKPALVNLVRQDCGSCHGMTLRGGLGPPLRQPDLAHLPVDALATVIREGVSGTAMPPRKALLDDAEIRWISEQLKSGAMVEASND